MPNPKYLRKSKKEENGNLRYEIVEIHSEGEWIHVRAFPQIVLFLYEILGDNSPPFICAWPPIFPWNYGQAAIFRWNQGVQWFYQVTVFSSRRLVLKKDKTSDTCASKCIQTFYFGKEIKQIELFLEPVICMIFLPEPLTTSWEASRAVTFLIQPCWTCTVSPFLFNMQITCSAVFRAIHISKISPQIFYLLEWVYNYEIQIQPGPSFVCLSGCKYEAFTQILPHTKFAPFLFESITSTLF